MVGYNYSPNMYAGRFNRYGMGPAHRWFDFQPYQPETSDNTTTSTPGWDDYFGGGSDGGNMQDGRGALGNGQTAGLRDFDSIRDYIDDFDVRNDWSNIGRMAGFTGLMGSALRDLTGWGKEQFGPPAPTGDFGSADLTGSGWDGSDAGREGAANEAAGMDARSGYDGGPQIAVRNGGMVRKKKGGLPPPRMISGPGDGRSDSVMANGGKVAVSSGEFVWPADTVSAAGNGSSEAGARNLGKMAMMLRRQHMNRMGALPPPGTR